MLMHNIWHYNFVIIKDFIIYLKIKTTIVAKQELKKDIILFSQNLIIMLIALDLNNDILLFDLNKNDCY